MDSNLFNIEPLHVAIDVGHAVLDGQTLALLVTDFIKFTLFMREQITAPYGEISAVVYKELLRRSQGETGCRSSLMNRHIKFISESEALFASLVTLFNDIRVSRLQIILGSSLSSFTEAFDIEFPRCRVPGINGGTMNKESDAVSRLFLRQLINRFADTHNICVRPKKNATCAHIKFSGLDIVTQTDSQDANPMDISSDLLWFQSDVSVVQSALERRYSVVAINCGSGTVFDTPFCARGERSESTNDDLVNRISERLVQGWTMLARHCPVCTTVLVGHRSHGIFCVGCQLPCVTEEDASAMQLEVAPSQIPQETVTDDDDDWQPPSAEEQRIMDERRAHRDRVSDLMASKLLAGWAMLNEHCETCATPLLRDPSQRLFCVACDAYSDEIRASPSAVGEGNASAVEPALHTRPPVTATSSLIEADDAASSQQHFELVDGKPLLFELGAQMKANLDQGWSIGSNAPKCNLCSLPFFVDPLQRLCCVFCNYYSPNTKADQETTQLPLSMSASTLSLTTSLNNSKVALLTKLDLLTVELTAAADSCSISRLANTIDVVARAIKSVSECSV